MSDQLPESESHQPTLEYSSGEEPRSRWPWAVWSFNAIALLVLVAIIVTAFPFPRQRVPRVQCGTNLHQLVTALVTYSMRNQGNLPPALRAAFPQSLTAGQSKLLQCPVGRADTSTLGPG